jgi:hypothetical protein
MGNENGAKRKARKGPRVAWRAEAAARVDELQGRLKAVSGGCRAETKGHLKGGRDLPCRAEVESAVADSLATATRAVESRPPRLRLWWRLTEWWTGASLTEAWESTHNAELALTQLETEENVKATIPRLLSWIRRVMDGGGVLRKDHEEGLSKQIGEGKFDRVGVRAALMDVIAANSNRYSNLRNFRNNLILVSLTLLMLVIGLSLWHILNTDVLPLCNGQDPVNCVSGGENSKPADVALVAAVGAIGGLLAIAFTLTQTTVAPSRYDPKTWLVFLKPVTGSATALIGVILLQAELLVAPAEWTEPVVLAYAAAFGFSQQLLTRFVDKRADKLIGFEDEKADEIG